MPARANQRAERTGTFHCRDCDASVRLKKGARIPRCPCGGPYQSRTKEPEQRSAYRARKARAQRGGRGRKAA